MISFSIFIASITQMRAPSSTSWPFFTFTFRTVPCSGETSVSLAPSALAPAARSRLGARRTALPAAATATPPAGGGPITFTVNRRLSTSTV